MHPRALIPAIAALCLSLAASAHAEEPGQDEVTLKNGGVIRGTVVASEPGTSVKIIEMGQKEVRVIPWAQVTDVERGKFAPKSTVQPGPAGPGYGFAPPSPAQPAQAPEPKLGDPGVVKLHIDSPEPAQVIERRAATVGAYGGYGLVLQQLRPVCMSPCDKVVDGSQGQLFTLSSETFPAPKAFTLAGMKGDVTLHVKPGSIGRGTGGVWLTILGGSSLLVGAIMLPLVLTGSETVGGGTAPHAGGEIASIALMGGGAAMLATGIALLVTSGTKITLEQGAAGKTAARAPRYWLGEF